MLIGKYVCIDNLGYDKSKITHLRLGVTGRYKHYDTEYDNVLGIGIPDISLNFLSCHGFSKNNESAMFAGSIKYYVIIFNNEVV